MIRMLKFRFVKIIILYQFRSIFLFLRSIIARQFVIIIANFQLAELIAHLVQDYSRLCVKIGEQYFDASALIQFGQLWKDSCLLEFYLHKKLRYQQLFQWIPVFLDRAIVFYRSFSIIYLNITV